jgi:hypothetical protein
VELVRARGRVGGRALTCLKMINELRTINGDSITFRLFFWVFLLLFYQVVVVLPTYVKTKLSLFTDKQDFQEIKTIQGVATPLKSAVGFTLRPL